MQKLPGLYESSAGAMNTCPITYAFFQKGNVTAHNSMFCLESVVGDRRLNSSLCPRLPDLNPCDIYWYVWIVLKGGVYSNSPALNNLKKA
jgi:hypothetical protein